MITMVSSMRSWKSAVLKKAVLKKTMLWLWLLVCLAWSPLVFSQNVTDISQLRAERSANEVFVAAKVAFDLPSVVEDALLKGIPMFFVAEADLLQERWYWYDKKTSGVQRQFRLAYQPLTRRWSTKLSSGAAADSSQGLALSQSYETLAEALASVKQVSQWKVGDVIEADPNVKYKVEFRFRLDLSQLPRPFQIGAIGQSEWSMQAQARTSVLPELK